MSMSKDAALQVPEELLNNLNKFRKLCVHYTGHYGKKGCKAGNQCKARHQNPEGSYVRANDTRVPTMSFAQLKNGEIKCTVRGDILKSFKIMFDSAGQPMRVLRLHQKLTVANS